MNTDFRVAVDFFAHHKARKLKKRLGPSGLLALLQLWAYAAKLRTDGELYGMTPEDIELAADWDGDDGALTVALLEIGFLEQDEQGLRLHDWVENNSWAAKAEERGGKARMSKLAQVNSALAERLKSEGKATLTKAEYNSFANAQRTQSERTETAGVSLAPAPAPAPSPSPAPNAIEESPIGDLSAEADPTRQSEPESSPRAEAGLPPCPHQQIIALYHESLPELPRVRSWNDTRKKNAAARWKEIMARLKAAGKPQDVAHGLDWWLKFFGLVRASPFLMGDNPKGWTASLDWLVLPNNFAKTLERQYVDRRAA